ncbi:7190_t:CDS:10 [Ambispora leptoticha]|uniref:7190_t:CDS:1 n=1 Tax=Ambispora leptoticha TaxID=144679 RepID=A0A9N9AXE2_9GLOM|nr:7190_t:CDS:10 [Ambispora leptoticha]
MSGYEDPASTALYSQYVMEQTAPAHTNGVTEQQQHSTEESAGGTHAKSEDASDTAAAPQQSDWDRYWDIVKTNPDDFASWEYLIRLAETAEGGLTPTSPPSNISNMRMVYDQFLAKFPLCFGYWKKYADLEFVLEGAASAEKIYERGVAAIANSVDLWTQYCAFKIEHAQDEESIRGLFERGAAYVGLDFLAHIFWDKYLEYEESKEAYDRVLKILERIIRIPMHQYAKFFDKYTQLCPTRPVTELVTPEQYQQFEAEAKAAPPVPPSETTEGEQPPAPVEKTEEQIQADIRMRIYNMNVEIYMKTQAETNKRWPFESEIKRPYFHVKPMDDVQLINWRRYLDFEETEGDETRIQVLFERCLVACALYDEFWQRYARWMLSKNRIDDVRNIYQRATSVYIPISRPSIHLSFACFEEEQGRIEESRNIYKHIMDNLPGHVETLSKYAHFERRQHSNDLSVPLNIIRDAIKSEALVSDSKAKAFLSVQHAKLLWHNQGSVEEARRIFLEGSTQYLDSKYFWVNYVNFEIAQTGPEVEENLRKIFEQIRNSSLSSESIRELAQRYLDFIMERGSSISLYNKIDVEANGPITARQISDSKKRGLEDEELERATKQVRLDGVGVESPVSASPTAVPYGATPAASTAAAQASYYSQTPWGYTAAAAASTGQNYQYQYPHTQPATTASTPGAASTPTTAIPWDYTQPSTTGY